jgi:hypothetical protein
MLSKLMIVSMMFPTNLEYTLWLRRKEILYMRITGRENEKALESKAMEGFYDKYGALPVGNGAFSFRK